MYGISQPFYFCFTRRYWCAKKGEVGVEEDDRRSDEEFLALHGLFRPRLGDARMFLSSLACPVTPRWW